MLFITQIISVQLYLTFTHSLPIIVVLLQTVIMVGGILLAKTQSHGIKVRIVWVIFDHNDNVLAYIAYPYNAVPTRFKSRFFNSSSLLLSWHSPDALYTSVIHVIEEYHIEVIDGGTGDQHIYTTEDTYLLIDSLKPNRQYTFRVAAFAGERGQFSLPLTVYTSKGTHVSKTILILLLTSI